MYPNARRLLVFLTPDGTPPNDEAYISFDYADLAGLLEKLTVPAQSETALIIRHYTDMLRRHIVPDPALEDIARQIYQRHKEAFDFVFACRPTPETLLVIADELLRETPGLVADRHTSSFRRFVPESWTNLSVLNSCPAMEWTKTGRTALSEIKTFAQEAYADRVSLILVVGPAPPAIREQLYRGAQTRPDLFKGLVRPMGKKWTTVYSRDLLTAAEGRKMEVDQKIDALRTAWNSFREADLPALEKAMLEFSSAG